MLEKITEFLDNKGINDEFIRDIVGGFINRHTELYGDVVPFESLMDRLNNNLSGIHITDSPSDTLRFGGEYVGHNKNIINLYYSKEDLQYNVSRENLIGTLMHELTHAAYTIKSPTDVLYGLTGGAERHIFGSYREEERFGEKGSRLVDGNNIYMEPIVNYISTRIFGQNNGSYLAETANFAKLATMIGEKDLIQSAFNSDEQQFRSCFEVLPEGAYEYFTDGMKWLSSGNQIGLKRGTEIMNNFFSGNIPSLTENQRKIKELQSLKSSLTKLQPLSQEQELDKGFARIRTKGAIDVLVLSMIVGFVCSIGIILGIFLIKHS